MFDVRKLLSAIVIAWVLAASTPVAAQSEVSDIYRDRADDMVALFNGSGKESEIFDETFIQAVPLEQIKTIQKQLVAEYGPAKSVSLIKAESAYSGDVEFEFEKAIVGMAMVIESEPPHQVIGLLVTGVKTRGDDYSKVIEDFRQLPGKSAFQVARLDENGVSEIAGLNSRDNLAIGSTFKLYILAELDRSIRKGERKWSDVVKLGPKSHPSGVSQKWPDSSPITLQTLATLMISVSDNTATDTLLRILGQKKLRAIVVASGHASPELMMPFLMTQQVTALKMPGNDDVRGAFLAAPESKQADIIATYNNRLNLAAVDLKLLGNDPLFIDQIEWFASPSDVSALMNYLRKNASQTTKDIMAINPALGLADVQRWQYLGYKGGSESGVISVNFLGQSKSGTWFAITGSWNDTEKPVNNEQFVSLMNRLVNLAAEESAASQ